MEAEMVHPIVAQMEPSPEQEPAVVERGRDVAVTAGAGTGKTRTLVARYLSLLAEGLPLRSIVAITFTRKAARAMRNRVREQVRRYPARDDLSGVERERWQSLYAALDAARIGTIHSLCAEMLRAHPAEARVDPRFEVLDEGLVGILQRRAVDEALSWAADDAQAAALFALLGEYGLRSALGSLLGQRGDVEDAVASLPEDLFAHWAAALAARQEQALRALLARPAWGEAVEVLENNAADKPDDKAALERQEALAALGGATGPLADRLASLARLGAINLGGGSQRSWPGGREQLDEVKGALRALRELWRGQAGLLERRLTDLDEKLAAAVPLLRQTLAVAGARYDAFKRERNSLDFDDLEQGALALLRGDAAVRARWQAEVRAILVDEFQDTNGRQRDLVALLNGNQGRLFIVGDAKQSIYRFRGADVTVFRTERERIERQGGAAFSLATSYRAHRALVEALNDLLRPVLGEAEDAARPWAEPFAPLGHHRADAGPGFAAPHVELHLAAGTKADGALHRAANALAARLVELVTAGTQVVEDGQPRPLDYGDVAILCRASRSFGPYEDALERAGVPFLTVAGRGFYGRPEIRDLLNGLQALADPRDDLALAGLLRSPAFALSDAALYRVCQARDRQGGAASLWDVLQAGGAGLVGDDGRKAERAARVIAALHRQAGRTIVADLLKEYLDATDYRAALIQAGQARGARNVAKLLADAHASRIAGVGEFLEYLQGLRDAGMREGEARSTAEGAVQVMSVHAAKGLEFPVVAIGDVTHATPGSRGLLVDAELGVLVRLTGEGDAESSVYELGKARDQDQAEAESERLFYVAATRAREKLILSGCVGLRQGGQIGKAGGWLGKIAGPLGLADEDIACDAEGAGVVHLDLQVGETPVHCAIYEPGVVWAHAAPGRVGRSDLSLALPPPLLSPVVPEMKRLDPRASQQERIPPQRVWRVVPAIERPRAPAWVVGSIVHEALAAWRFPDGSFEHWAEARARGYGVADPRVLADAIRQSRRLLERFAGHSLYQEMNRADRRLHEVPYSLEENGRIESGIIDALYLQDGLWTVVEFKTDDVQDDARFRELLEQEDYVAQARRYVNAVERLLGQRPRSVLCMLNHAGGVRLHAVA
ncbi:MAG: UvrD-helicase domain-containing protein [Anaerolineae bacterium]|nr:UvrD-helicase domain-containing protein [Anaerolineae bacterium]